MTRLHALFAAASLAALPFALGGCPAALIVGGMGAAGGVGYQAAQERGLQGSVDDFTIKTNIESAWLRANPAYQAAFTATVYDGHVLLTGNAPDPAAKQHAVELARAVQGVKGVYDQIEVLPNVGTFDTAKDSWITTQLRSNLVFDSDIRSGNYTIETANQTVYLMGSARSQAELDKVTNHARYIPGVRRVVSFVQIRSGVPVAQQQGPAPYPPSQPYAPSQSYAPQPYQPPSSYAPGGGSSGPAPASGSIQVQRL